MGSVIGDLLPIALGVAVSPMPVIAVILMLLAPRARAAGLMLLAGWVVGVTAVVTLVTLAVDPVDSSSGADDPSTLATVLKLLLGVAAIVVGIRQWRQRPGAGREPTTPAWMGAIDHVTPVKAFGLGVLLSAVNPKNLTLGASGGVTIASGGLSPGRTAVAVAVFVVIASLSMAVPVVGYLVARERMEAPLRHLRDWLTAHNATVMAVLMLGIGVVVLGQGLAGL